MDIERDRKSFGEWLERMQHASHNIAEVQKVLTERCNGKM
jgi:hypothetical protein